MTWAWLAVAATLFIGFRMSWHLSRIAAALVVLAFVTADYDDPAEIQTIKDAMKKAEKA